MQKVVFTFLIFSLTCYVLKAQVKGNQKIITKTVSIKGATEIVGAIYAEIEIEAQGDDLMTITADENIIPLINNEVVGGKLTLRQKDWIQSSQRIKIKISVKDLQAVSQEVHEHMIVKNISSNQLRAMALLGSIELNGKVNTFNANAESGELLAENLKVDEVIVSIWDDGKLILNTAQTITGQIKNEALIRYNNVVGAVNVNRKGDAQIINVNDLKARVSVSTADDRGKFIKIKLKNNSPEFISAYVRGPKPDGKYFSYGFNLAPGQVKKERWTVGTKVFRVNKMGLKKKLITLRTQDENEIVELF